MNDNLIAQELAAVLSSTAQDAPYAAMRAAIPTIQPAQAGAQLARPNLEISGAWKPYGHRRKGMLILTLKGRMGDEQTASPNHSDRFELLFAALCGAPGATVAETRSNLAAAKEVLKTAVNARGKLTLDEYGLGEDAVAAGADGEDLVTTLQLMCVWSFVPQV